MNIAKFTRTRLSSVALSFLLLLGTSACADLKHYGKFEPNTGVTAAFNKAEINPNLNYYITGSDRYPRSILGLDKAYTLDSDLWKPVEFKPEELLDLTTRMQLRAIYCRRAQFGFAILDDQGKQIGIWYSLLASGISIKLLDNKKVVIYPPNDSFYACYDDRF
jgi:hypothetical protein